MLCFIEPVGLAAGMLRPGGATANNAADQLAVIDQAIACLPESWQAGHHDGDDRTDVRRRLMVRADTAGGTAKVTKGLAARNLLFSVGMRANDAAAAVIADIDDNAWVPAVNTDGQPRDGAEVAEVPNSCLTGHRKAPVRSCAASGPTPAPACGCGTTTGYVIRSP
jgi:hypothetical protein